MLGDPNLCIVSQVSVGVLIIIFNICVIGKLTEPDSFTEPPLCSAPNLLQNKMTI